MKSETISNNNLFVLFSIKVLFLIAIVIYKGSTFCLNLKEKYISVSSLADERTEIRKKKKNSKKKDKEDDDEEEDDDDDDENEGKKSDKKEASKKRKSNPKKKS